MWEERNPDVLYDPDVELRKHTSTNITNTTNPDDNDKTNQNTNFSNHHTHINLQHTKLATKYKVFIEERINMIE